MIQTWQLLVVILAGWLSKQQQDVIEYLKEENRILRGKLKGRRPRFTDDERRRLAAKGRVLGRKLLAEIACIATPDTILRWHRTLIARKYDGSSRRRPGRPRVMEEIRQQVLRMARENPSWGYGRIRGALRNLGHKVGRTTVMRILKEQGISPAPERRASWSTFLKAHWDVIAATDLFTVEAWSLTGLVRYSVLFFMDLSTRKVQIAGIMAEPTGERMKQVARNLTDPLEGFLSGKRYVIHDRDPLFTKAFAAILKTAGVKVVKLPPRSPNLNAYAERFVRSIKSECLDRMILFGENRLRRIIDEYVEHYHRERNHQGLGNRLIVPAEGSRDGPVRCRKRVGGLLKYYYREAA